MNRPALQGVSDPFAPKGSFSFTTHQNAGTRVVMPAQRPVPNGSTITTEFDSNPNFPNPVAAGTTVYYDGQLSIELTPFEVNAVKSGNFRVTAVVGNTTTYVGFGTVSFIPADTPLLLDGNAVLTTDAVSTVALSGVYSDLIDKPDVDEKIAAAIETHKNDNAPHPVYDDLPSLNLLFENGMM